MALDGKTAMNAVVAQHRDPDTNTPVEFPKALLYVWDDDDETPRFHGEDRDLYSLLTMLAVGRVAGNIPELTGFVIATSGWAAPLTDPEATDQPEVMPSRSPDRRRCSLWISATVDGTWTTCHLAESDGTVEVVTEGPDDESSGAGGPLAEAVDMVGVSLWGDAYTARLFAKFALAPRESAKAKYLNRRLESAIRGSGLVRAMLDEADKTRGGK